MSGSARGSRARDDRDQLANARRAAFGRRYVGGSTAGIVTSRAKSSQNWRDDRSTHARAFWIAAPGRGEIRERAAAGAVAGDVVVRALYSGISRGTEALVFQGRVPPSEHERMRAPFQAGEFPAPVKYGYASVGTVERGPRGSAGTATCSRSIPHQTRYVVPATVGARAARRRPAGARRARREPRDGDQRAVGRAAARRRSRRRHRRRHGRLPGRVARRARSPAATSSSSTSTRSARRSRARSASASPRPTRRPTSGRRDSRERLGRRPRARAAASPASRRRSSR